MPAQYADLTGPETYALLKGAFDRRIEQKRDTRFLATMIHNCLVSKPITERELMPLPGDEEKPPFTPMAPEQAFAALAAAFNVTPEENAT